MWSAIAAVTLLCSSLAAAVPAHVKSDNINHPHVKNIGQAHVNGILLGDLEGVSVRPHYYHRRPVKSAIQSHVMSTPIQSHSIESRAPVMSITQHYPIDPCKVSATNSGTHIPGDGSLSDYLFGGILQANALNAPTPYGYNRSFVNEVGAVNHPASYLTYFVLNSIYDTDACAVHCNAHVKCKAFNIYYARDPKFKLVNGCRNPEPVTNVRCALFAAEVTEDKATNDHQYSSAEHGKTFQRIQVGSNGYNRNPTTPLLLTSSAPPPHFATYHLIDVLDNAAILSHTPTSSGPAEYMSVVTLPLKVSIDAAPQYCAQACTDANNFNKNCVFFNTYSLVVNGEMVKGVKCALFARVYGRERAGNRGYDGPERHVGIVGSSTWECVGC